MDRWEEDLVAELRDRERRTNAGGSAAGESAPDPLTVAFDAMAQSLTETIERVGAASGLQVQTSAEAELGRYEWQSGARRLRLRLDRGAGKFFLSLEGEAGMDMSEVWNEEGTLLTGAKGQAIPAELPALTRRYVKGLFTG